MRLTDFARRILLDGDVPDDVAEDANPFIGDHGMAGTMYLRFDSICIDNTPEPPDAFGKGVVAEYRWRGRAIIRQRVEGITLVSSDGSALAMILTLSGFEARMRLTEE